MHHLSLLVKSAGARCHEKTKDKSEARAESNHTPWIVMDILVGCFCGLASLRHDRALNLTPGIFTGLDPFFDLFGQVL